MANLPGGPLQSKSYLFAFVSVDDEYRLDAKEIALPYDANVKQVVDDKGNHVFQVVLDGEVWREVPETGLRSVLFRIH